MNFKLIAIIVFSLTYVYKLALSLISLRSEKNPIPENVSDVYDTETYEKWRAYHSEKIRFDIVSEAFSFVIMLALLISNAFAWFATLFPDNLFMQTFSVVLLLSITSLASIPFAWHDTMKIEQKYGFNKSSAKTFWVDQLKSFIIELVIMTGIGSLLFGLHVWLGDWLILAFAVAMTVIILFVAFLYPFLSKIFNKFTPLEDGELREKLTALLEKNGYRVRAINVMDASRRTTKSNAYFSGFGKMKTIVLYDNLLDQLSTDEICAVFAHELGHGLHKDTLKNQILSFFQMAVISVLAWLTLRTTQIFTDFGFESINYGMAIILIMSVEFAFISPLFSLLVNFLARRAEYAADGHAAKEGYTEALISGLKILARENYADLAPSPLIVKLEYSHPTLSQRITALSRNKK